MVIMLTFNSVMNFITHSMQIRVNMIIGMTHGCPRDLACNSDKKDKDGVSNFKLASGSTQ